MESGDAKIWLASESPILHVAAIHGTSLWPNKAEKPREWNFLEMWC